MILLQFHKTIYDQVTVFKNLSKASLVGKRIAIVSNTSWSIYNFRLGLLQRLREEGCTVHVIAPKDSYSSLLIAEGFQYHNIAMKPNSTNPLQDLSTAFQLFTIYRKQRINFIFHYTIKPNIYGSIAASMTGTPSIAITTGLGHLLHYKKVFTRVLAIALYRLAARLSHQVWFLNQDDYQIFLKKRIVSPDKAYILPSEGVNIQHFKPNYQEVLPTKTTVRFLFAGRIIWDKGIQQFVNAARIIRKRYPNTRFDLLGFVDPTNPNAVSYDQLNLWQAEGVIRYLGETEDVRPVLSNTDCLVFPSYYREGVSRILLEASSMSIPIITTDNVGCREVVEHEYNGFLCKMRSTADLVQTIERFLALSQRERLQMGLNGRKKIIQQFDEQIILDQYIQILSAFMSKTKKELTRKTS